LRECSVEDSRSQLPQGWKEAKAGEVIGDQVSGTHYTIFKVRVRNSDIQKGKRSGYRLIYHVKTPKNIILVTIYSKLNQALLNLLTNERNIVQYHK
jgi:mRNA-degrading endonuclease RelE of RelBE toxin-antitoxin system